MIELPKFEPPRVMCDACIAAMVKKLEKPVDDEAWQTQLDGVPVWMAFVAMGVGVFLGVALTLAFKG